MKNTYDSSGAASGAAPGANAPLPRTPERPDPPDPAGSIGLLPEGPGTAGESFYAPVLAGAFPPGFCRRELEENFGEVSVLAGTFAREPGFLLLALRETLAFALARLPAAGRRARADAPSADAPDAPGLPSGGAGNLPGAAARSGLLPAPAEALRAVFGAAGESGGLSPGLYRGLRCFSRVSGRAAPDDPLFPLRLDRAARERGLVREPAAARAGRDLLENPGFALAPLPGARSAAGALAAEDLLLKPAAARVALALARSPGEPGGPAAVLPEAFPQLALVDELLEREIAARKYDGALCEMVGAAVARGLTTRQGLRTILRGRGSGPENDRVIRTCFMNLEYYLNPERFMAAAGGRGETWRDPGLKVTNARRLSSARAAELAAMGAAGAAAAGLAMALFAETEVIAAGPEAPEGFARIYAGAGAEGGAAAGSPAAPPRLRAEVRDARGLTPGIRELALRIRGRVSAAVHHLALALIGETVNPGYSVASLLFKELDAAVADLLAGRKVVLLAWGDETPG